MKDYSFLAVLAGGLIAATTVVAQTANSPSKGPAQALPVTRVEFQTADNTLQELYVSAEARAAANLVQYTPELQILVEGENWPTAHLETQPMGGHMYAKRNLRVGLSNQIIFIDAQRADGRFPGRIVDLARAEKMRLRGYLQPGGLLAGHQLNPGDPYLSDFGFLEGYCFATPAWKMYFLAGRDRNYLQRLYGALERYDAYLWRTRDSDGNGVLELWCVADLGEDNSRRFFGGPELWPFDYSPAGEHLKQLEDVSKERFFWPFRRNQKPGGWRPEGEIRVPFQSMDMMSWSYSNRDVLARISRELNNGLEDRWRLKAEQVRRRLIEHLWREDRHACFDRDKDDRFMETLIHNNLKAMYAGIFTQAMADAFIRHHMLNPAEFWTPYPLPCIAANDPLFRNDRRNDWSGAPMGLTYQRAIDALENYGHFAEVTMLGRKLIEAVGKSRIFAIQYYPFTMKPREDVRDGYGPTILAFLEYVSRLHGVHIDEERVLWSGLASGKQHRYAQNWGAKTYVLENSGGEFSGRVGGKEVFRSTEGVRVITDLDGHVREVVGIAPETRTVFLQAGGVRSKLVVEPNQVWRPDGAKPALLRAAPFDYPYRNTAP